MEEKREERQIPIMTTRISDGSLFFHMTQSDNVPISTNLSLLLEKEKPVTEKNVEQSAQYFSKSNSIKQ